MLNYAVEYRGLKTKEEKGMEQIVSVLITVFFFWVQSLAALVPFCQFSGNVNDG
jgi:hypothetical protein